MSWLNVDRSGQYVIGISRRLSRPDGTFAGVVVGTLRLQYFHDLFQKMNLGARNSINLFRIDGTLLARNPHRDEDVGRDLSNAEFFANFQKKPSSGWFEALSKLDGVHRLFTYARVGDLPLLVTVGMSTEKIYAGWRRQALFVVAVALILCLATFTLVMRLRSELKRRSDLECELETLARTDGLTKLANRRYFDQTIEREWSRAQRNGEWLALLMIDADRFKSFNDRYGHQEGDALLSWTALCIADAARRGTDFPARYGGEEFVVLLTSADRAMAQQVAETIRHSVEMLQVDHADAPDGFASVSIGVAFARPDKDANPRTLIAAADRALFDAKRNGRNRIEFSDHNTGIEVSAESTPRLVA